MASNINLIFILVLTFYAGNGSLLRIRREPGCIPPECGRSNAGRTLAKRSLDGRRPIDTVEWSPTSENDILALRREFWTRFRTKRPSPFKYVVPWRKRNGLEVHAGGGVGMQHRTPKAQAEFLTQRLTSQFIFRTPRAHRQYDVPQIECPQALDGMDRFACPSPDRMGRYRCIDDHYLCDGFIDCPSGEDEDRQGCMFYKTMKSHLDIVADAVLGWVRGRQGLR